MDDMRPKLTSLVSLACYYSLQIKSKSLLLSSLETKEMVNSILYFVSVFSTMSAFDSAVAASKGAYYRSLYLPLIVKVKMQHLDHKWNTLLRLGACVKTLVGISGGTYAR